MNDNSPPRPRLRCPRCQGKTTRVRRSVLDRLRGLVTQKPQPTLTRYKCRDKRCAWHALMRRSEQAWVPAGPWLAPLLQRLRPALLGVGGVLVAALAWSAWQRHQPPAPVYVQIGPREVARGASYDGDALPVDHPMMLKAAHHVEAQPVRSDTAPLNAAAGTPATAVPLAVRRHCSWGLPGRSPYRGSVEQALHTAHVPADVVRKVAASVAARQPIDRVRITNDEIVAERSGRRFDHRHVAMTYGMTLCADTRVNFKAGHVERADLFEAKAEDGRKFSVMVPDVCGNVSVLAETAAADDADAGGGDLGKARNLRSRLPDELIYRDQREQAAGRGNDVQRVPEPGTLLCALTALLAVWRLRRHRSAAH
jgi:hypothetical protein